MNYLPVYSMNLELSTNSFSQFLFASVTVTALWILCTLVKILKFKSIHVEDFVSLEMIITVAFRKTMDIG